MQLFTMVVSQCHASLDAPSPTARIVQHLLSVSDSGWSQCLVFSQSKCTIYNVRMLPSQTQHQTLPAMPSIRSFVQPQDADPYLSVSQVLQTLPLLDIYYLWPLWTISSLGQPTLRDQTRFVHSKQYIYFIYFIYLF